MKKSMKEGVEELIATLIVTLKKKNKKKRLVSSKGRLWISKIKKGEGEKRMMLSRRSYLPWRWKEKKGRRKWES